MLLTDIAIFVLMSRISPKKNKVIESISRVSFGIYLMHVIIVKILGRYYQPEISSLGRMAVIFIISFGLSQLVVSIIGKIKPLSDILLFQKRPVK